tara:strand:+ start:1205 stop:1873 length:669 start_codon:yes stop_codon:yes gene_type:complete
MHDVLGALGWDAHRGYTVKSKSIDPLYRKHMIRYRSEMFSSGKEFPEIVMINSHDGSSSFQLKSGLFRLVCSNGMIVQSKSYGSLSIRHNSKVADDACEMIDILADFASHVQDTMRIPLTWRRIMVEYEKRLEFYRKAAQLRSKNMTELEMWGFEQAKRTEDQSNDLWTVYNRTQEYLVNGGYQASSANGRQTTARPINSIDGLDRINTKLYQLAEEVALNN